MDKIENTNKLTKDWVEDIAYAFGVPLEAMETPGEWRVVPRPRDDGAWIPEIKHQCTTDKDFLAMDSDGKCPGCGRRPSNKLIEACKKIFDYEILFHRGSGQLEPETQRCRCVLVKKTE